MDNLVTVLLLGLSVEGLTVCPFLAFGMTLSDRLAGLHFLCGRLLGIVCFGIVISLMGDSLLIDKRLTNLVFGIFVIALGGYRLARASNDVTTEIPAVQTHDGKGCGGGHGGHGSGGGGGRCRKSVKKRQRGGFGLGLYRGFLNPGRKYLYLAPLLLGAGVLKGAAISLVFGLASSVYLALGFLSAGLMERLLPRKRLITAAGGIILIFVGTVYAWKGKEIFL